MKNKKVNSMLLALLLCIGMPTSAYAANTHTDTYISDGYLDIIEAVAEENCVCPELIEAIIESESSGKQFNKDGSVLVSSMGCVGIMQVSPMYEEYAEKYGLTIYDVEGNIRAGVQVFLDAYEETGDLPAALVAYNTGINSSITKKTMEDGIGTKYSQKIIKRSEELERIHNK